MKSHSNIAIHVQNLSKCYHIYDNHATDSSSQLAIADPTGAIRQGRAGKEFTQAESFV